MRVVPIASGKGGVGKSLVSVNLSIALSQAGFSVLLVDLDLGASNAHTILGMRAVGKGLGHFLSEPRTKITDVISPTEYDNLFFLPGEGEIPGFANLYASQKKKIQNNLFSLEYDFIILDLGAGTGHNTLDFFLSSDEGILVITPSLTSTLNAYLFLKNAIFRLLETSFPGKCEGKNYLKSLKKQGTHLQNIYLPKLFSRLEEIDPENYKTFIKRFNSLQPRLIINMLEDPKDGNKATKIRTSCQEYLGIELDHFGIIYKDHLQDIALNSRLPIIVYKPQSVISQAIYRIAEKVVASEPGDVHTISDEEISENYHVAEGEAENDFLTRSEEIKELLNSGVLSPGDLVETIRTQQYEIRSLKKENSLLKQKLVTLLKK